MRGPESQPLSEGAVPASCAGVLTHRRPGGSLIEADVLCGCLSYLSRAHRAGAYPAGLCSSQSPSSGQGQGAGEAGWLRVPSPGSWSRHLAVCSRGFSVASSYKDPNI